MERLNNALEMAIQLGLRSAQIEAGVAFRDELAEKEALLKQITAAAATLRMKASSKGGITQADVDALSSKMAEQAAVVEALAARSEVQEAKDLQFRMTEVLKVQVLLNACAAKGAAADRNEVLKALR